jgi:hypothetical protein
MPGETRNYTFKLPVKVADIDSIKIMFYQDGEKLLEYNDTMTEKVYGVEGEANLLICSIPREDTLKFENKLRAQMQMEWDIDNYHSVTKVQNISVGDYLNKEYLEGA